MANVENVKCNQSSPLYFKMCAFTYNRFNTSNQLRPCLRSNTQNLYVTLVRVVKRKSNTKGKVINIKCLFIGKGFTYEKGALSFEARPKKTLTLCPSFINPRILDV